MKPKFFYDIRVLAGVFCFIVWTAGSVLGGYLFVYFIKTWDEMIAQDGIILAYGNLACAVFAFGASLWLNIFCAVRMLPILRITDKKITWWAPFHRAVSIDIKDCKYVGVADFEEHNRGLPELLTAYIYVSVFPLPSKYRHKIDMAKCKKGFIKFCYYESLCETLIEVLSEDQSRILSSFYERSRAIEVLARKEKHKKKRKAKKK
ncbi:MAG: hypothetical protein J6S14_00380 [Clostridia bacterium]|nr:hypothetical protein [Clostridia bacterium]